ncbi:unnamed protein product [Prorocentrum cordatum]|uniref:Uncharacterized protein n=1 Tax=Prorocentrum cordatum TaxID=2364126 RepID=A0ABN9YI21_9DINO|nr:unnamed protein product [Polarella glacialis]
MATNARKNRPGASSDQAASRMTASITAAGCPSCFWRFLCFFLAARMCFFLAARAVLLCLRTRLSMNKHNYIVKYSAWPLYLSFFHELFHPLALEIFSKPDHVLAGVGEGLREALERQVLLHLEPYRAEAPRHPRAHQSGSAEPELPI